MKITDVKDIETIVKGCDQVGYVTDPELATAIFLMIRLKKPLLIEGHAGVGKTEVANVLSSFLDTELIRLQCYEGLDVSSAIYEWNYQKQLLAIKIQEKSNKTDEEKEKHIFGPDFLLERPLLKSITAAQASPILLIDEIDRSDDEFEAFLLELLSQFQISIPEMGTIKAKHLPYVILTSNRTRELGDALKRRCLYHWVDYPDFDKELKIVQKRMPHIETELAVQVVTFVQSLRYMELSKSPGIAETLDWALGLLALQKDMLDRPTIKQTIGCLLKSNDDITMLKTDGLDSLLAQIQVNES